MWLIHIDTWNYADPQKIIDLVPQDIRPYVVMNISLSISHDSNGVFKVAEYGYEVAKSWARTCAQNNMWFMIQQSSGGMHQFTETNLAVYEEFFQNYPNFLGFNYAEHYWGFDVAGDPVSADWTARMNHLANLLQLSSKYGGYLVVSWCGNQYSPNINPIGMLKRIPAFAAACTNYTQNFILLEKYTTKSYQYDKESTCLGAYLSGYSGQYGIRYDSTGWTDAAGTNQNFTLATGGAPQLEHEMLSGETVVDAPELIWLQCFEELSAAPTDNGYTMRQWQTYPQFNNVSVDLFRKILDGTVRIPTRQEVINRTKEVVINDVNSGSDDDIYSSPMTLFEGLYQMDGDGDYQTNFYFFKQTGRYPAVPTVYQLADAAANSFQVQVDKSGYSTRWPTIANKTNEFNSLFPQEYTGNIYAGRLENGWVIYNPYKTTTTNTTASGSIPFKYNTCDHVDLTLSQYTSGVMKEYSNSVTFYLCNYDNDIGLGMRTDTITIYGSSAQPTYSYVDRASHQASVVGANWSGGVWTLTVQHNGSIDITVNCAGTATGRLTSYTPATLITPDTALTYTGPLQYEAECFDYKNIAGITKNGYATAISNYTGQGYVQFGTSSAAAVRDIVTVLNAGTYNLQTRYSVTGANVSTIDLYVNGTKVATPVFTQTATLSAWATNQQSIALNAGTNTVEFRANATAASSVYFDNIVVAPTSYTGGTVIQENDNGFVSVDGTIDTALAGYTGTGYANTTDAAGAGIDWQISFDSSVTKSFTFRYASTSAATADLLVNGTNVASNIQFPATASTWQYVTVYPSVEAGFFTVRLQATSTNGLPYIDYVEVIRGTTWTPGTAPTIPAGLSATAVSSSQINLSWNPSGGVSSYNVKRASTSGGPYTTVATGVTSTSYSDTGLPSNTAYYYVVSAVNAYGESANSSEVSATTLPPPPPAPTGLSGTASSSGQIQLTWSASSGATSYNVKRGTVSGGPYTTVASRVPTAAYTDTTVYAGTTFYYVVSAVTSTGSESANSTEASVTTPSTLALGPVADSYVNDGGSASSNFGTATNLVVKADTTPGDGFNRETYLKFDVHGAANASSVTVTLTPFKVDGSATLVYAWITNNTWNETGITWNNQPAESGTVLANISGYTVGAPVTFDVTSAAKAQAAVDGYLSIRITESPAVAIYIGFNSKEAASAGPVMHLTGQSSAVPAAPTGLRAAGGNLVVNLNWTQSTNSSITGNHVYRSTSGSGGPYNLLANLAPATSYSDTAVSAGSTYYYSVTAINGSGESAMSAYAGATTIPPAPTGLAATPGNNQVALSWTVATGATSYNVKRATVSGGPYTTIAHSTTASYTDTTAVNGTTYYYVISAVNGTGESANSSQVSATPQAPAAPAAPTNLTASSTTKRKITLNWTQSASPNITSNGVYRATINGGPYTKVTTIAAATTYTDTGLTSGATYYYVVTAINSSGSESAYSTQATATSK